MQPLKGITVATRHLADMGARVVKIERPGVGDFARGYADAALMHKQQTGEGQRIDAVPALGQHTAAILAGLGYKAEQIVRLRAEGEI